MHVKSFASLAPALLIGVGLVAAPAHAQQLTLQSGDNVTVGSAGTTGTFQGLPYSTSKASYSQFDSGNTLPVVSANAGSAFTLNSGGSLQEGNSGYGVGLGATDSTITINGGYISAPTALQASGGTVTVTGGTISGTEGLVVSKAVTQISGGNFSGNLFGADIGGTVDITGGTFTGTGGGGLGLLIDSNTFATISGGTFTSASGQYSLNFFSGSAATISGGSFSSLLTEGGTIDLLGNFPQTAPITSGSGYINGTLLNGQALNTYYSSGTFYDVSGGLIEFNQPSSVPEASSVVSMGLLLALGLGGLAWGARRRRAQTGG